MIAILSPARNVRPATLAGVAAQPPLFMAEAMRLVAALREYSPWQLESLLDVNPERAFELYDGYQRFGPQVPGTPALLSFYGAAYRNMGVSDFDPDDLAFAQGHLRILSALYGLLRPADSILPYRLGLKRDFLIAGRDLYAFWGDRLYRALFQSGETVVSLASEEFSKLVTPYLTPGDAWITCRFLVQKPGCAPKGTVSTVRAARGLMARYLVKNRITAPEGLKGFDAQGYRFVESRSAERRYVFVQEHGYDSAF